jgi:hypothetical protein
MDNYGRLWTEEVYSKTAGSRLLMFGQYHVPDEQRFQLL